MVVTTTQDNLLFGFVESMQLFLMGRAHPIITNFKGNTSSKWQFVANSTTASVCRSWQSQHVKQLTFGIHHVERLTFRMLQSSASVSRWFTWMINGLRASYRFVHRFSSMWLKTALTTLFVPVLRQLRRVLDCDLRHLDNYTSTWHSHTMGRRGFYYACPAAWNALPSTLTSDS